MSSNSFSITNAVGSSSSSVSLSSYSSSTAASATSSALQTSTSGSQITISMGSLATGSTSALSVIAAETADRVASLPVSSILSSPKADKAPVSPELFMKSLQRDTRNRIFGALYTILKDKAPTDVHNFGELAFLGKAPYENTATQDQKWEAIRKALGYDPLNSRTVIPIRNADGVFLNGDILSIILGFSSASDVDSMMDVCKAVYYLDGKKVIRNESLKNAVRDLRNNVRNAIKDAFLPNDWSNFGTITLPGSLSSSSSSSSASSSLSLKTSPSSTSISSLPTPRPLPDAIRKELSKECPFNPGKIVAQTHVLVYIPELVNGQPLTFNSFRPLMENPVKGSPTPIRYIWEKIIQDHGNTSIRDIMGGSGYVFYTKDVIPGSRNQTYDAQQALITRLGGAEYEPPSFLEMLILIAAVNNKLGISLYGDNPLTYSRSPQKSGGYEVVVGGFSPAGVCGYLYSFDYGFIGVGACRKFPAIAH